MHNCVDENVWSRCGCDFFAHNLSRPNCTIEQFMKCGGKAYIELYMSDILADVIFVTVVCLVKKIHTQHK